MNFKIAFDKNLGLELFVYNHMYYDVYKKIFFSSYKSNLMINPLGTLLLMFLNTDFENEDECESFVFWFCFENLYYEKYPEIEKSNRTCRQIGKELAYKKSLKEDKILDKYRKR